MALPGLTTSNISFIGFWNALDNGLSSIDPTETSGEFSSYDEYSNGLQGTVNVNFGYSATVEFNARVKDDGWIVVWINRTYDTIGTQDTDFGQEIRGPYNVSDNADTVNNNIESVINDMFLALSNSPQGTYNASDVGLYNYQYESATNYSIYEVSSGGGDEQGTVTPQSGVTVYEAPVYGYTNSGIGSVSTISDNDSSTTLAQGGGAIPAFGLIDGLAEGYFEIGETTTLRASDTTHTTRTWMVWG